MPARTRGDKSTAPSPSSALSNTNTRSSRSKAAPDASGTAPARINKKLDEERNGNDGEVKGDDDGAGAGAEEEDIAPVAEEKAVKVPEKAKADARGKGKGKAKAVNATEDVDVEQDQPDSQTPVTVDVQEEIVVVGNDSVVKIGARAEDVEDATGDVDVVEADAAEGVEDAQGEGEGGVGPKLLMEERMEKLRLLRTRMNQSTAENRRDLIADHQKQKVTAKELVRLEKQRKLAQTLRLKADAEASGEDLERRKAWEWSIEENERWEKKMEEQKARSDTHFHNAEDDAFKKYNRNIRITKPDLLSYERSKEAALGLAPGTLVPINATSSSLALAGPSRSSRPSQGLTASEDLYRGADTLAYGDNKPSEDAIDRVVGKINADIGKKKRKEKDDSDEPVTYINDRNKVFNKKIARYFDKYTKEIRASFERGTAL